MTDIQNSLYYPDKAIQSNTLDRFNFNPTAEILAQNISKLSAKDSYTIAVNGAWGSGKSSFLNLVRHHLENSGEHRHIVLNFDPWMFSGREDVVMQLFLHIRAELQKLNNENKDYLDPAIFETFDSVLGCIQAISNISMIPVLPQFVGGLRTGTQLAARRNQRKIDEINNINTQRKQLMEKLQTLSEKMVIIVDNIDRLTGTEIRQIFQAIKSVSDFPNIVYVLAYDQKIVEEALDFEFHQHYSSVPESGRDYLKKIVQFSMPVPDTTPYLKGYAEDMLLELNETVNTEQRSINPYLSKRWHELYEFGLSPLLKTPRDIIRLHNILILTTASLDAELDYLDMLCIQVLREYEPELYEEIKTHPKYFCGGAYNFSEYDVYAISRYLDKIESPSETEMAKYFKELFLKYAEKPHVLYLLFSLFIDIRALSIDESKEVREVAQLFPPYVKENYSEDNLIPLDECGVRIFWSLSIFMKYFGCHMTVKEFNVHAIWRDRLYNFWDVDEFRRIIDNYHNRDKPSSTEFMDDLAYHITSNRDSYKPLDVDKIIRCILSLEPEFFKNMSHKSPGEYYALWDSVRKALFSILNYGIPSETIKIFANEMKSGKNIVLISFAVSEFYKLQNNLNYKVKPFDEFTSGLKGFSRSACELLKDPYGEVFMRLIGDNSMNLVLPYLENIYVASQLSTVTKEKMHHMVATIWENDDKLVEFISSLANRKVLDKDNLLFDYTYEVREIIGRVSKIILEGNYPEIQINHMKRYLKLIKKRYNY